MRLLPFSLAYRSGLAAARTTTAPLRAVGTATRVDWAREHCIASKEGEGAGGEGDEIEGRVGRKQSRVERGGKKNASPTERNLSSHSHSPFSSSSSSSSFFQSGSSKTRSDL